jgi:hypothetical protein
MRPAPHTAEEATPSELRGASLRLMLMFGVLALLVVPLVRDLPLGKSSRIGLFAWLLVILALYWLYAGLGYRPLLLLQLFIFSAAAALLTFKVFLVIVDVRELTFLRQIARMLIMAGGLCAGANLMGMLVNIWRRPREDLP